MRRMKLVGILLTMCFPALVFAESGPAVLGERALREECSEFSQAEMRDCLAKRAESSLEALQEAEEDLARLVANWDEDDKYVKQAEVKAVTSNNEFAAYRDAQCRFSASLSGGAAGNTDQIRHFACISELNNRRVAQLRDAVIDLPLK